MGNIPDDMREHTRPLRKLFHDSIPEEKRKNKTYHQWYDRFPPEVREMVDAIRKHPFWQELADGIPGGVVHSVSAMDELYYSRAPKEGDRRLLYGAAGNYALHIDGIFRFSGVRLYRVLIGLTDNPYVETRFPTLGVSHMIGQDEYLVFDFDRARHQVVKLASAPEGEYRILLKLHFCVHDPRECSPQSCERAISAYVNYEHVTRYVMQTGTDPETPYQFFLGYLSQVVATRPRLLCCYPILPALGTVFQLMGWGWTALAFWIATAAVPLWFLSAVLFLWARYRLFKIR